LPIVLLALAGALVARAATTTAPTMTASAPGFVGKPYTVRLDDREITGTRSDG
jgi:hypothetical protein